MLGRYKRRWFKLTKTNLEYYKDMTEPRPAQVIPLDSCTVNRSQNLVNQLDFEVRGKNTTFILQARDKLDLQCWIRALRQNIIHVVMGWRNLESMDTVCISTYIYIYMCVC